MNIKHWLLLAGVLVAGACSGSGPLASCTFAGDKAEYAPTAYQSCPGMPAQP
jgi:hypothetical protein